MIFYLYYNGCNILEDNISFHFVNNYYGAELEFFISCLTNCKQVALFGEQISEIELVKVGMFNESVWVLCYFVIYVNDFSCNWSITRSLIYTDDI